MLKVFLIILMTMPYLKMATAEVEDTEWVPKPCQILLDCPDTGETAFAADRNRCYVFKNSCTLRNANCRRHNVYFRTLLPTTKMECKTMCDHDCHDDRMDICVKNGENYETVKGDCKLNEKMCREGKYIAKVHSGKCVNSDPDIGL